MSTGKEQANAQMASIRQMVAALDVDYERLEELKEEKENYVKLGTAFADTWEEENPDDAAELAELLKAADGCESEDDARERILEDAISVEVRSDWHSLGEDMEAAEFRIVICTGGPHVQIRGELAQGEPSWAWLEYSDWFRGMEERVNQPGDEDILITYASQFYFGE